MVLHAHLTDHTLATGDGMVRCEEAGPMLLTQLLDLLREHSCSISLRPVLDPADTAAVDAYEIPQALREAVTTRHPASIFPYSSRSGWGMEIDHTRPHTRTPTPSGQTGSHNLGPLGKHEHTIKTPRHLARRPTPPRRLPLALTPRPLLPSHQPRHPTPRTQTPVRLTGEWSQSRYDRPHPCQASEHLPNTHICLLGNQVAH